MDFVLEQVVKGGGQASIDEKKEQEREILTHIARLTSSIERDHYLKKAAETLGVPEEALRDDLRKLAAAPAMPREGAPAGTTDAVSRAGQRPRAEEMLIHLMLRDEAIARDLAARIAPGDFTDPLYRRAAERIFAVLASGGSCDVRSLSVDDDEELNRLFTQYSVLEAEYADPQRICDDCVDRIRQQGSSKRIKMLLADIQAAEARGDTTKLAELQRQLIELRRDGPR